MFEVERGNGWVWDGDSLCEPLDAAEVGVGRTAVVNPLTGLE